MKAESYGGEAGLRKDWPLVWIWHVRVCSVAQSCPSLQSYRLHPTRLLCPWDYPGKNTGVGGHFFLQGFFPTQASKPASPALGGGFFITEPLGHSFCVFVFSWINLKKFFTFCGINGLNILASISLMLLFLLPLQFLPLFQGWKNYISHTVSKHNLAKHLTLLHPASGEGNGNPLQYSCLENPMDRGAW